MKEKLGILASVEKKNFFGGPISAVYDRKIIGFCRYPYPGHSQGCPNWNRKVGCPPQEPFFPDIYENRVWVVAVGMDLSQYLKFKKQLHPEWTERALANSRHWQGHLRALLRRESEARLISDDQVIIYSPEALGVNVFATCKQLGLSLEQKPQNWIWMVSLLGKKREV